MIKSASGVVVVVVVVVFLDFFFSPPKRTEFANVIADVYASAQPIGVFCFWTEPIESIS